MFLTGSCSHSLTVQSSFWWSLPSSSSSSTTRSSSDVHGWQPQTRGHSSPGLSSVCTAQPGRGHHSRLAGEHHQTTKYYTAFKTDIRWCVLPPGLKHVSDEQKTHKNPNLRSEGGRTHQGSPAKSQNPSSSACAPAKKHSPVLELEGKKWRVVGGHTTWTGMCLNVSSIESYYL